MRNVQPRTAEGATQRPAQSAQGQVRRTAPAPAQKTQQGTQTAQRTQQRQQAPARTQATQRPQTGTRTQAARPQTTTRSQAGTSQAQRTARPVRQPDPAARTTQTRTARPAEPSKVQGKTPTTAAPKKTTPHCGRNVPASGTQTHVREQKASVRDSLYGLLPLPAANEEAIRQQPAAVPEIRIKRRNPNLESSWQFTVLLSL